MEEDKKEENKEIDLSTEKARVDYFAAARPIEKEEFQKNHPGLTPDVFDEILNSAAGNALQPDFSFIPNKYETPEKIDGVNRRIGDEIERITGVLESSPLGGNDLSRTVNNFDGDASNAGKKLRVATGQNLQSLNEYINELKEGVIKKEDLPDNLENHELKDLLLAQNITLSNYLKELGFPRTEDFKGGKGSNDFNLEKLFSKDNNGSIIDRTNETNIRKEEIRTDVKSVTNVSPIVETNKSNPFNTNGGINPLINEKPNANVVSISPTSINPVTNVNNTQNKSTNSGSSVSNSSINSSNIVNTTSPIISNNSTNEFSSYQKYDPIDEIGQELGFTPRIETKNPEGINENVINQKESTSSVAPGEPYDAMEELGSIFNDKPTAILKSETSSIREVTNPSEKDNKMAVRTATTALSANSAPNVKSTGGIKLASEIPHIEKSEPSGIKKLNTVVSPTKEESVHKEESVIHEKNEIVKTEEKIHEPSDDTKPKPKEEPKPEPINLERLEGIMLQILSALKGPLLTIDGGIKYS